MYMPHVSVSSLHFTESGSSAFEEFLNLIGQRVRMKGFTKYRAQLDNKSEYSTWQQIL